MKGKILAMLLTAALVGMLAAGCSSGGSEATGEDKTETQTEEQEGATAENQEDDGKADEPAEQKKVFVTPEWVQGVIDGKEDESDNYMLLEVSWGAVEESPTYKDGHLPGAVHVDTSSVESEPYWNLSEPEVVEKGMLDVGVTKDKTVILYGIDVSEVCRVAYAYLWAGVEDVKVLNGGLDAWKKAGYKLEKDMVEPTPAKEFGTTVPAHPEYWLSMEDAKEKLEKDDNFKLVSIRSREEFEGKTSGYSYIDTAGEPKGAVWGHAGSDPYHMEEYLHEDGTYITYDEMIKLWSDCDFTVDNELSFYCGTGWRATIPWLLCYEGGMEGMTLYDGGWYQWQLDGGNPVQVGDPAGDSCEYTTVDKLPKDKAAK